MPIPALTIDGDHTKFVCVPEVVGHRLLERLKDYEEALSGLVSRAIRTNWHDHENGGFVLTEADFKHLAKYIDTAIDALAKWKGSI